MDNSSRTKSIDGLRHPWARMKKPGGIAHCPCGRASFRDSRSTPKTETVDHYLARGGAIKACPLILSAIEETGVLADARDAREIAEGKVQMFVGL